jgi:Cytochrome c7 and related cytochrome c
MRRARLHYIALLCLVAAIVWLAGDWAVEPPPAMAQQDNFFTSSPGPLTTEHKDLDDQARCEDCHVNGSKALSNEKCLGCHDHKDLKKRIDAGEGYHSSGAVRGRKCETCHVEHKNRNFDIMGWRTIKGGEKSFNHALTGWPLRDKHSVLECLECHKNKNTGGRRTYLGESRECGTCHQDDDPHEFDRRGMMRCERCHTEVSWKPPRRRLDFDHNNKADAEFPQEGAHADVACGKCHPKSQFNLKRKRPGNCGNTGCHVSSHEGHLFDKKACDWCHSPVFRSLKRFDFNHAARTRFSLAGAHGKLTCYKCHTKTLGERKPDKRCANCHADDNPHRDRFAQFGRPVPACETCHPESSYKPTRFNHGARTKFPLQGKHGVIACRECHRGKEPYQWERFEKTTNHGQRCMSCHEHKNVHNNEFTDQPKSKAVYKRSATGGRELVQTCLECHFTSGTTRMTKEGSDRIHGPRGRWPLTGEHARIATQCEKCHLDSQFRDTPKQCGVRCHEDSLHKGSLGDQCDKCHEPGRWEAVRFDHNSDDTDWPLNGLHRKVPKCDDCHPSRIYANTPRDCSAVGCHAKDDAHRGKLGDQCGECHLETGENVFNHNLQADYKLEGAHLTTRCVECHPSITFKPRPKDCYGGGACHPEPDVHKGQYGTVCETCHSTRTFKDIQPQHDVGDFSLRGQHDNLPCKRCHMDNRPLAGTGNFCINCHRQDDIHSNSLSPRCGECHTQWSFAPARFDHSTVGCNLTGLHRTLPCYDCHKTGNFGGLSPTCYSCHADLMRQFLRAEHQGGAVTNCANCHNPNSFVPANDANGASSGNQYGRESICR